MGLFPPVMQNLSMNRSGKEVKDPDEARVNPGLLSVSSGRHPSSGCGTAAQSVSV